MADQEQTSDDRRAQVRYVQTAEMRTLDWARLQGMPLRRIEYLVAFGPDDYSLTVYLFFETDAQVVEGDRDGTTSRVKDEFRYILADIGYPNEWLDQVTFVIDSQETVARDFEGNYSYRLR